MSTTSKKPEKSADPNDRTIYDHEIFSPDGFKKRLRISYATYAAMIKAGLPVRVFGRYRQISGHQYRVWMESQPLLKERINSENATA